MVQRAVAAVKLAIPADRILGNEDVELATPADKILARKSSVVNNLCTPTSAGNHDLQKSRRCRLLSMRKALSTTGTIHLIEPLLQRLST